MSDYDSPWKEILDAFFPEFLAFFFPAVHTAIDWSRGFEMLDKELQQLVRDAEQGRRTVDKLVRVWRLDGREEWMLIHVEVQSQGEADFGQRMFLYHIRLFDRHKRPPVSLAVLGDEQTGWRPRGYEYELLGCRLQFEFPVVKLQDYAADLVSLEASTNPFATVVLAHVQTQQTRRDPENRCAWKVRLVRNLYERGASREMVHNLWRFIDWLMDLPGPLEEHCWQEVCQIQKEKRMPYITSTERMWMEKGRIEMLHENIALDLEFKFGAQGLELLPVIQRITDTVKLRAIQIAVKKASTPDEVRVHCQ